MDINLALFLFIIFSIVINAIWAKSVFIEAPKEILNYISNGNFLDKMRGMKNYKDEYGISSFYAFVILFSFYFANNIICAVLLYKNRNMIGYIYGEWL